MSVNAKQIQKINYFSKVPENFCSEIAKVVEQKKCSPGTILLKEGETGDTMLLVLPSYFLKLLPAPEKPTTLYLQPHLL